MVPFSFENITRSASLDVPSAYSVSDAARATHESFESHLQRAAASTLDPPARRPAPNDEPREQSESGSNEAPRNEPVRQDADETRRDDADVTTATETSAQRSDEDAQRETAPEDETVIAATIQAVELEVADSADDSQDKVAVKKLAVALLGSDESELDTSLAMNASESSAGSKVKRISGEPAEPAEFETQMRHANSAAANEEVADGEFHDAAQVAEPTSQDDESSKTNTTQRRGHRGDIAANQATNEPPDVDTKPVAVGVVEATVDTTGEDGSRQRHSRKDTDGPQPTGNATAADATTTTPGTPSRFAQHLLARTDDSTARGLSITNADQARFVERVARAVHATGERGGTLRLRLSPPELGALTLEVKVQGGVVSARVEADTPAARSLLLENLPLLRERLAEHGMRVDQFDVDLSDRHAGGTPDGLQQNDQQHEDRPRAKATSNEPDDTSLASPGATPIKNGNEQLNIIV